MPPTLAFAVCLTSGEFSSFFYFVFVLSELHFELVYVFSSPASFVCKMTYTIGIALKARWVQSSIFLAVDGNASFVNSEQECTRSFHIKLPLVLHSTKCIGSTYSMCFQCNLLTSIKYRTVQQYCVCVAERLLVYRLSISVPSLAEGRRVNGRPREAGSNCTQQYCIRSVGNAFAFSCSPSERSGCSISIVLLKVRISTAIACQCPILMPLAELP